MIKTKGHEYPVSFFKLVLPDTIADKIAWIRTTLQLQNNIQVFANAIDAYHSLVLAEVNRNLTKDFVKLTEEETKAAVDLGPKISTIGGAD